MLQMSAGGFNAKKILGIYSIKQYGALGDGIADDTAAIQATIDAVEAMGEGVVFIPAGTYLISSPLTFGSNIRIQGIGNSSILKNKAGRTDPPGTILYHLFEPNAPGVSNSGLYDLWLDHNLTAYGELDHSPCISVNKTINFTISNITFDDVITMAIWADSFAGATTTGLLVSNCRILKSSMGGLSVFGDIWNTTIVGCVFSNCKDDAISFSGTFDECSALTEHPIGITISGCTITDCNRRNASDSVPHGILLFGAEYASITGVTIDKTLGGLAIFGISAARRTTHVSMSGCTIRRSGDTPDSIVGVPTSGIRIGYADDITIGDCGSFGSIGGNGIEVIDSNRIALSNLSLSGNYYCGASIANVMDGTINSCLILDNGDTGANPWGILLDAGTAPSINWIISGNRIGNSVAGIPSYSTTHGIYMVASGIANSIVNNNDFTGIPAGQAFGGVWGTGMIVHNNTGYVTRNYNAAPTINDGGTIAHGLAATPLRANVTASVAGEMASVTLLDATNITVAIKKHDGTGGTQQTIYWEAEV